VSRPRREPGVVAERHETARQALIEALRRGNWTVRELAQELGLAERDVGPHLEHIARSVTQRGAKLQVEPAACIACDFVFEGRQRTTRPSRCPRCKSERLRPARYGLVTTQSD
jgi:hypothetical protein